MKSLCNEKSLSTRQGATMDPNIDQENISDPPITRNVDTNSTFDIETDITSSLPCLQQEDTHCESTTHRVGLINPHIMCYVNSLYQAILFSLLSTFIDRNTAISKNVDCDCIGCILRKLTKMYRNSTYPFTPAIFHNWALREVSSGNRSLAQEDVHEFYQSIMSSIGNAHMPPDKTHYSHVSDELTGTLNSTIYCSNCFHTSDMAEDFLELMIHMSPSIQQSLDSYFLREYLDGYECRGCRRINTSMKSVHLLRVPPILCMVLNCFDDKGEKINDDVLIDINIDLNRFASPFLKDDGGIYHLKSVIRHDGKDKHSGHYVTLEHLRNYTYLLLNDDKISTVQVEDNMHSGIYMLFYEQVDKDISLIPRVNVLNSVSYDDIKKDRFDKLKQDIRTENNDPKISKMIDGLIYDNTDVFHIEGDKLTSCDILEHTIPLFTDTAPINVKPYDRRSKWEKDELERKVQKLLKLGIIEPSRSPFNSPLHLVKKGLNKDGSIKTRLVVDFTKLNSVTIKETYPSDQAVSIFDQLHNCQIFSKFDLSQGYYQVKLSESCKHKTAFSSGYHHYSFLRMPLGLRSSSHTFNRVMRIALADLIGKILYLYLDDVIVYSSTIDEHVDRLKIFFATLRQHNLKLSPEKSVLLKSRIPFLGFIVSEKGIEIDPSKIQPIVDFVQPKTQRAIKSFLGMCGYFRRHIPKFSEYAKPMTNLLKKDVRFVWTNECSESFKHFKHCLTNPPILQYPDFSKPFQITTDASKVAVSAILSQGQPPNDLPIAYASRKLLDAETRYGTSELEITAILFGIRYFKPYIGFQHFVIRSDCQALTWLFQVKSPSSRLLKWKFKLAGYDYEIQHVKGSQNTVADCLSRYVSEIPIQTVNVLTRAQARVTADASNPSYVTPEVNRSLMQTQKTKPIALDTLPVVMETTDDKLAVDFTTMLIICDSSNLISLQEHDIRPETIRPGEVVYQANKCLIITEGISIDFAILTSSLSTLHSICTNRKLNKLLFLKRHFHGTNREYELLKKHVTTEFQDSNIHFLFVKDEIIHLTNLDEISQILKDFHNSPMGGHQGVHRMADKISSQYKWEGLRKDVQNFVRNCAICQVAKPKGLFKQQMQITSTSHRPWQRMSTDCTGPLPETADGLKYILTFQDDLTKYFGAVAMKDHTADTVARNLVEHAILRFGVPEAILSDLGAEYTNELFKKIMKILGVKHYNTSPYHPACNGSIERQNSILKNILRSRSNGVVEDWPQHLPYAVFVINSQINSSTKFSPNELLYGYKLTLPTNLTRKPEPVYTYDNYLNELRYKLQVAHTLARENAIQSKEINKQNYDKHTKKISYKVGDKVLLANESRKTKMHNPFKGPYDVLEIISDVDIKINTKDKDKIVHINRTKLYHDDKQLKE
ncbi:MAG TPA: RNase H-like domain-containing protein [Lactovum miscens]|uniref:RNase H-like domain-containing protein n=1 Tax=Lactovum miscens TaxID=190387 RepID=UPI002ED831AF